MVCPMTCLRKSILALACLFAFAAQAHAACIAEYKAKRDTPFELYYDVTQISGPCTLQNARAQLTKMLAAQGLVLLKVLSVTET